MVIKVLVFWKFAWYTYHLLVSRTLRALLWIRGRLRNVRTILNAWRHKGSISHCNFILIQLPPVALLYMLSKGFKTSDTFLFDDLLRVQASIPIKRLQKTLPISYIACPSIQPARLRRYALSSCLLSPVSQPHFNLTVEMGEGALKNISEHFWVVSSVILFLVHVVKEVPLIVILAIKWLPSYIGTSCTCNSVSSCQDILSLTLQRLRIRTLHPLVLPLYLLNHLLILDILGNHAERHSLLFMKYSGDVLVVIVNLILKWLDYGPRELWVPIKLICLRRVQDRINLLYILGQTSIIRFPSRFLHEHPPMSKGRLTRSLVALNPQLIPIQISLWPLYILLQLLLPLSPCLLLPFILRTLTLALPSPFLLLLLRFLLLNKIVLGSVVVEPELLPASFRDAHGGESQSL